MFVVCVKENDKGKAEMTREELQKMLDDAYHKGWEDGFGEGYKNCNDYFKDVKEWKLTLNGKPICDKTYRIEFD